jgi:hypothetical protein
MKRAMIFRREENTSPDYQTKNSTRDFGADRTGGESSSRIRKKEYNTIR